MLKTHMPYGILVTASYELNPEAPVQKPFCDSKEDMLDKIRFAAASGYRLDKDQIFGYLQNEADALAIKETVKSELGHDIHLYMLSMDNVRQIIG